MKEEVKKFVEAYNRHVEWNRDILKGDINLDDFKDETKYVIQHYFDTNKITEKDYDLDGAKVFYYTGKYLRPIKSELQVNKNKSACTYYFWCVEDATEEEYKAERLCLVNEEINRRKETLKEVLKKAKEEIKSFDKLYNVLNK